MNDKDVSCPFCHNPMYLKDIESREEVREVKYAITFSCSCGADLSYSVPAAKMGRAIRHLFAELIWLKDERKTGGIK